MYRSIQSTLDFYALIIYKPQIIGYCFPSFNLVLGLKTARSIWNFCFRIQRTCDTSLQTTSPTSNSSKQSTSLLTYMHYPHHPLQCYFTVRKVIWKCIVHSQQSGSRLFYRNSQNQIRTKKI